MRRVWPLIIVLSTQLLAQVPNDLAEQLKREVTIETLFRDPAPKFAKLTLTPVGTAEIRGHKAISYSMSVTGVKLNRTYMLMTWDIGTDAPMISRERIRVDGAGLLKCDTDCPGSPAESDLAVRLTGMLGQPRRFVLAAKDKNPVAIGEAVPFPAIGKDGECTIEAVVLRPDASATLLIGQGFVPGEVVKFLSSSRGETVDGTSQADARGKVLRMVLPFVKGFDDGQTSATLQGSNCHPSTVFNWGSYREEQTDLSPQDKAH